MAPSIDLNEFENALQKEGFEAAIDDNVLSAQKESGSKIINIKLDAGGGCLIKRISHRSLPAKKIHFQDKDISVVNFFDQTAQVRLVVANPDDLAEIIHELP